MAGTLLPTIPTNAVLYQRAVINQIGATAQTSNGIGYLATNKTQLEVAAQVTGQDPVDFYNFTFQNDGNVNFNLIGIDGTVPVRVQFYDGTGSRVLADSEGTGATKDAFNALLSKDGLQLKAGKYVVKVTYGTGADKSTDQNYAFQIGSGNTFQSDYRTLGQSTTIQNTLLSGGSLGYNSLSSTAALLTAQSNGTNLDIFGVLALFPTKIF